MTTLQTFKAFERERLDFFIALIHGTLYVNNGHENKACRGKHEESCQS